MLVTGVCPWITTKPKLLRNKTRPSRLKPLGAEAAERVVVLNVLDGTVIGRNMQRHRHQGFIRFLNVIEKQVSVGKDDPRHRRQLCRP
jgi:hypothetical protein